jgi:hypothetical protein
MQRLFEIDLRHDARVPRRLPSVGDHDSGRTGRDGAVPAEFRVSADRDAVADDVGPEVTAPAADRLALTSPIVPRRRADRAIVDRYPASPVLHLDR